MIFVALSWYVNAMIVMTATPQTPARIMKDRFRRCCRKSLSTESLFDGEMSSIRTVDSPFDDIDDVTRPSFDVGEGTVDPCRSTY